MSDELTTDTGVPQTVAPVEPIMAIEPTALTQTEATAEVTPPTPEPPTAQLPPNEPFADPASAGGGEIRSAPDPAQPEPASQSVPAPEIPAHAGTGRQAPVIVIQNRIKDFFAKAAQAIQFRKQKKLAKIMGLFLKKTHITNDEVEKLLHVSDATATRYLSQLEKQGKIKQSAKTGKGVTYTKL